MAMTSSWRVMVQTAGEELVVTGEVSVGDDRGSHEIFSLSDRSTDPAQAASSTTTKGRRSADAHPVRPSIPSATVTSTSRMPIWRNCACPCGGEGFEITAGVSLYEGSEDVEWLYLGCRCPRCGLVAVFGDWATEVPSLSW